MSLGNERKVQFSALLELRQLEQLDNLARSTDEPKSQHLRRALDQYLDERQAESA